MSSFDETWMSAGDPLVKSALPGFGSGNRTPQTSRVHKNKAAGERAKKVRKGLARSAVVVKRTKSNEYEVRVKGTRALIGKVHQFKGVGGVTYAYGIVGEPKLHKGFPTQKAAVLRMLEKI